MTNEELIAAFLAKGGSVTRCKTVVPAALRGLVKADVTQSDIECEPADDALLDALQARFEALRAATPDAPQRGEDWWAEYEIGPCDPFRAIAEAAGEYVIARDEGKESARLYRKEVCARSSVEKPEDARPLRPVTINVPNEWIARAERWLRDSRIRFTTSAHEAGFAHRFRFTTRRSAILFKVWWRNAIRNAS